MIKVLISGALGKMGANVISAINNDPEVTAVCGVDRVQDLTGSIPVYEDISKVTEQVDVVIDFSSPKALDGILSFISKTGASAVLCSTGYTKEDIEKINQASKTNAIFRSANMSLGVNVLIELVKTAVKNLAGFDIEIIEKHHNLKVDAPSGTALMLADAVKEVDNDKFYVYGRNGMVGKRDANEIGIHAIRGGNIVGEHDVIFAGSDEVITLSHHASDRKVFAFGAVKAAKYLATKKNGLYNMTDLLNNK
ncbi:MAG: 4-hydroxy-tetrahydrodipicolinate reductase [Clostridia bacterium]|nr:4-hydroxy-tetrahydrodipicolinate reductase [Clostridia bacterium]